MLTSRSRAARYKFVTLVLAVLFSLPIQTNSNELVSLEEGLNELVYRISPSVVTVQANFVAPQSMEISTIGSEPIRSLISSGIIVDSSGHILVAASSVVGSNAIFIQLPSQRRLPVKLIGTDYVNGLSLLRSFESPGPPVTVIPQYLCAGQMVLAVGNAHGQRVSPSLGFCAGMRDDGQIQFNSLITAGSIGGGLFDLSGRLVGVISGALCRGGENIEAGLAVPSGGIREIIDYLTHSGDRAAGYVGMTTREIEVAPPLNVSSGTAVRSVARTNSVSRGLLVTRIDLQSPASEAGLRPGDLIYAIDNNAIYSAADLQQEILHTVPGRKIRIELIRGSHQYRIDVTIAGRYQLSCYPVGSADAWDSTPRDSILAELNQLKESVRSLENRLMNSVR